MFRSSPNELWYLKRSLLCCGATSLVPQRNFALSRPSTSLRRSKGFSTACDEVQMPVSTRDGCQYSQAPRVACFAGLSSTNYLRAICQPLGSTRLLWIQTVLDSMSLEGLAKVLSNDEMLRERVLTTNSLISWPSPKLVGVCKNKDALRLNSYILQLVADNWCPQWTSPAMIPIDLIKLEAPN